MATNIMGPSPGDNKKMDPSSDSQVICEKFFFIEKLRVTLFFIFQNSSAPTSMMDKLSNYIIVDIGANLTNKKFSRDLDQVIQRAREAGVTKIMVTGTSLHSTKEALRLTRLYPGSLYSTAGIHPHDAKSWDEETCSEIKEAARLGENFHQQKVIFYQNIFAGVQNVWQLENVVWTLTETFHLQKPR